jgi:hypothetical protein
MNRMWTIAALTVFPAVTLTLYWLAEERESNLAAVACIALVGPGLIFAQAVGIKGTAVVIIASTLPLVALGALVDSGRRGMAALLAAAILLGMGVWLASAVGGLGALGMRGP